MNKMAPIRCLPPKLNKMAPIRCPTPKLNKMAPKINKKSPKIGNTLKSAPFQYQPQKLRKCLQALRDLNHVDLQFGDHDDHNYGDLH